jgi:hypothetical protein
MRRRRPREGSSADEVSRPIAKFEAPAVGCSYIVSRKRFFCPVSNVISAEGLIAPVIPVMARLSGGC